jgi:hypothetical protein
MSKCRQETEETREEVLRANTNQSTSKQAWSFSKQKRFIVTPSNCACFFYSTKMSTLSDRKTSFGSLRRRVFTEGSEAPSSWVYTPHINRRPMTVSFAKGRDVTPSLFRKSSPTPTSKKTHRK